MTNCTNFHFPNIYLIYFKQFGVVPKLKDNDREKLLERKREKQKLAASKEEEKMEKRRAKDEAAKLRKLIDKEKELEKKIKRKSKPNGKNMVEGAQLTDFLLSEKNFVPLFMEKCVEFIEQEGLDSEGIYRVPGNRAHVELLYQKLQEGKSELRKLLDTLSFVPFGEINEYFFMLMQSQMLTLKRLISP